MVVRQRSSAGSPDPTISKVSARKKDLLLNKLKGDGVARTLRTKGSLLPVVSPEVSKKELRRERSRAWSDDAVNKLSAALDSAEVMMDRRTLPLNESSDELPDKGSSSRRTSRSKKKYDGERPSRRSKKKTKADSCLALPLYYRINTASRSERIGFGILILVLHAVVCLTLAASHSWPSIWPVARPYVKLALDEARWNIHRFTGGESREVSTVLADLQYVNEKRRKTLGEIDRLQSVVRSEQEADEMAFVVKALEIKEASELDKIVWLQKELQFISREQVIAKFGAGPHFVQFDLEFSDGTGGDMDDVPHPFIVQMAPLSNAPHSVHVFLEQVSQGFWDGQFFVLNPGHLVMATAPIAVNGVKSREAEVLKSSHAVAPAFPEYSASYPHRQYTLGFVAARAAPHFYLNTKDNIEIHGPGKQGHDINGGADPCFGEVVVGHKTVQRIQSVPTKSGPWLKEKVRIVSARIVSCHSGTCEHV